MRRRIVAGYDRRTIGDANRLSRRIARDRLGKKPLHYRVDRDGLAFASEPKAFLAEASFEREVDLQAISEYLSLQYVPAPRSAFSEAIAFDT